MKLTIFVFLISLLCHSAHSNYIFYEEGESAVLDCTGPGEVRFWLLNGFGDGIQETTESDVYMHGNGSLQFDTVDKSKHEGTHLCVTAIEERYVATRVKMVVKPLPPQNLWEERYRRMFTIGIVSALICFLIFAGGCLVNKYRWVDPTPKMDKRNLVEQEAYANPAMREEDPDTVNIKM